MIKDTVIYGTSCRNLLAFGDLTMCGTVSLATFRAIARSWQVARAKPTDSDMT